MPLPGTKVRLTGYFLKCTGQQRGSEGLSRWTIVACECSLCKGGDHVATNEPAYLPPGMYDDLPVEQRPKWRHIALCNLEIVGAPPRANDYPLPRPRAVSPRAIRSTGRTGLQPL